MNILIYHPSSFSFNLFNFPMKFVLFCFLFFPNAVLVSIQLLLLLLLLLLFIFIFPFFAFLVSLPDSYFIFSSVSYFCALSNIT